MIVGDGRPSSGYSRRTGPMGGGVRPPIPVRLPGGDHGQGLPAAGSRDR
ncbi:MAG: hypothetical protein AVDCRST_MAG19-4330 [uncultured Thermomicrobiales bacterium]|uniref:Uncharacterized protein n=1 Tax=uncultured Thermomicrobiales bacterium TaxID=1645740 RepID=A0A6J4VPA6_9BACT|nr:MAG: hypothetical protein AVDCRST_MAG19-4330 [uncultured Thermomicrobiales bacterium]